MKLRHAAMSMLPAALVLMPTPPTAAPAPSCDTLAKLSFPDAAIDKVTAVPAGDFTAPAQGEGRAQTFKNLPGFCRVAATLRPTSDSDIKVEVWLPATNWNGKFQAVGNGGWAGVISYAALAQAVRNGYATSSTDTGHKGATGKFAPGHPEKLADFGWRSEHEMTVKAKAIVAAYYGNGPKLSYWNGCSTGGRQGLM